MPEQLGLLAQEQQSPKLKGLGPGAFGGYIGVHSGAVWASKILGSLEFKPMPKAVESTLNLQATKCPLQKGLQPRQAP